jgi:hypothetical protein
VWVHIFEPHTPYDTLTYAGDVRQADAVAGLLVDGLAGAGRGDAAILVTSDHGEMLDELGERTHGHLLADAVLRVPFLLVAPGLAPGQRDDPVDLGDVAPTLAGLADVAWDRGASPFSGRDLLTGPVPAERVRVAESLYARQRFRWAQVVAATDAHGTVLDVGEGRAGRLLPVPYGTPQAPPRWDAGTPSTALLDALALYKRGEVADRMKVGAAAGPYHTAGAVEPFLPSNANALLLNPYDEAQMRRLELADRTRGVLKLLLRQPNPRLLSKTTAELEAEIAADPKNPDLRFLAGLAAECRISEAQVAEASDERLRELSALAEAAYGVAFRAGREDADTLYRWCAVNVPKHDLERHRVCLERLTTEGRLPGVIWNAPLWTLKSHLHDGLGQRAEASAACAEARKAARTPRERRKVEQACTGR